MGIIVEYSQADVSSVISAEQGKGRCDEDGLICAVFCEILLVVSGGHAQPPAVTWTGEVAGIETIHDAEVEANGNALILAGHRIILIEPDGAGGGSYGSPVLCSPAGRACPVVCMKPEASPGPDGGAGQKSKIAGL
ncbi:MAG: hypothetical protein MAG453_00013 [Calditrichaeota bacterium]|nr:hypothetical protein [Calditrichota bacterium]